MVQLDREPLEARLRDMDPERDEAIAHATRQIRLGARDANRAPMPRALSR